jgi:hypothetical protein
MLVREVFNLVGLVFNKIYRVLTILKGQNFNKNTQKKNRDFTELGIFRKKITELKPILKFLTGKK